MFCPILIALLFVKKKKTNDNKIVSLINTRHYKRKEKESEKDNKNYILQKEIRKFTTRRTFTFTLA